MKKKIISLCLVVALGATAVVGGTLAYFTDKDQEVNTFTVGNVDIDLTEPNWDATGKAEAEDAYPGEALAKDPTVENIGKNPCFVRLSVTNLDQFVEKFGEAAMIDLRHGNYAAGYDNTNWTYYNGYYYYNDVLTYEGDTYNTELKTKTEPLFNQIVMPTELTNNAATKDIVVTAQAVQAQGAQPSWSAVKNMTVEQIAAWFATCMPVETPAQ